MPLYKAAPGSVFLSLWNVTYRLEASIALHLPTAHRNIRQYSTVSTVSIPDIEL
jgi:hypothetical protein